MEVVPASRRQLMEVPAVRGYVQDKVFSYMLYEHVNGKGTRAIVCRLNGGWAEADQTQSMEYPLLAVDCWADCTRDVDGRKLADDAIHNALAVYRAVDPVLHRRRGEIWGGQTSSGILVINSKRWTEPMYQTKTESHGGMAYGIELGESAVVTGQYALTVAHYAGGGHG